MSGQGFSASRSGAGVWSLSARIGEPAPEQRDEFPPVFPVRQANQSLFAHPPAAEDQARAWLAEHPSDSDATYILGAALRRQHRGEEARAVLEPLTASQPQMAAAWRELGLVRAQFGDRRRAVELFRHAAALNWFDRDAWLALGDAEEFSDAGEQERFRSFCRRFAAGDYGAALADIAPLLAAHPADGFLRAARGLALAWSRQFDEGVHELAQVTDDCACGPGVWLEFARLLRATNDERAADAFARAIALLPSFSEAYAGLANSKSIRIGQGVIERVREQLDRPELPAADRARFSYVLGKGLEDLGSYAESFAAYRASNEILKRLRGSGAEHSDALLREATAFFTKEFFVTRGAAGADAEGPIFIVGMPRSGSTLVEQILSNHPQVEALGEISNLTETGQRFAPDRPGDPQGGYPRVLQYLDGAGFRRMGEEYVRSTLSRRRTDRPYFTDKMPGNFCHVGLIHLALPNARIIDVRRHPLDCCLSCYKHHFPAGHLHTLDLADIGRFYANYVALMAHFDEVLPGRVHRLAYENLVENPEMEMRRLLDHLGLPFDEACLRFYENRRPVLTFSADQVRQPLFNGGIGRWRHYDTHLGPLRRALGDVLDAYPGVPALAPASIAAAHELSLASAPMSYTTGRRRISFGSTSQLSLAPPQDLTK